MSTGSPTKVTVELNSPIEFTNTFPFYSTPTGGSDADDYSGLPSSVKITGVGRLATLAVTAADDSVDEGEVCPTSVFHTLPFGVSAGSRAGASVSLLEKDSSQIAVARSQ